MVWEELHNWKVKDFVVSESSICWLNWVRIADYVWFENLISCFFSHGRCQYCNEGLLGTCHGSTVWQTAYNNNKYNTKNLNTVLILIYINLDFVLTLLLLVVLARSPSLLKDWIFVIFSGTLSCPCPCCLKLVSIT